MSRFLCFRLHGPLCAWGDIAVGEERNSQTHPGRSAVLGLVAACLGRRRAEEAALLALERGLGLAVLVQSRGEPLRDFHTAQVPPAKRGRRPLGPFATRREEILALDPEDDAILSRRDYRQDGLYLACLWRREAAPPEVPGLEELAAALESPRLIPCLGRKSCPAALPFLPQLVEAPDLAEACRRALIGLAACPPDARVCRRLLRSEASQEAGAELCWEPEPGGPPPGIAPTDERVRRDALHSRARWQYHPRREARGLLPAARPPQEA